jgi:hypothetical protein
VSAGKKHAPFEANGKISAVIKNSDFGEENVMKMQAKVFFFFNIAAVFDIK